MKIKIIKEVWMFEDDFKVGEVYDAVDFKDGVYMVVPEDKCGTCAVYESECEVVEE